MMRCANVKTIECDDDEDGGGGGSNGVSEAYCGLFDELNRH